MTYGAESIYDGKDIHKDNFENSYPFLLGKKLKNVDVANLSVCGKSNYQIFCHNIDYLFKNISDKENFIFITQWSWFSRFPKIVSVPQLEEILKTADNTIRFGQLTGKEKLDRVIPGDDFLSFLFHDENEGKFWYDVDPLSGDGRYELSWDLLDNMSLLIILSYMNLLDNYNVKNLNYISQPLHHIKFSPVFMGSHIPEEKYNLCSIKKEILSHKNFLMDNWVKEFICKKEFLRKNNHASVEAHQLWANKLLRILRDRKYV